METVDAAVNNGTVTGIREKGICRFSAIPYAEAPVGNLRFKPPVPAQWHGRRVATQPGPVAPQLPSRLRGVMGDFHAEQSEDCLHLTVWTPGADTRRRPVLVWLHGGAWQSGAGALDWYSGAELAAKGDLVVVAPNYRLGALGWLYVPGQSANVGLLDQEAAISWVLENIESFGGDPSKITVMGQSAGAFSIACLLMREPKFSQAIMQSAPLGRGFRSIEQATVLSETIFDALGAQCLEDAQRLPHEAFLQVQNAKKVVEVLAAENSNHSLFCPVADGKVITTATDIELKAAAGKADVIIGYTKNEMAAFSAGGINDAGQRLGEEIYGAPARHWASHAMANGRTARLYQFDLAPTENFGACHCLELPFVFGTFKAFTSAPMMRGVQHEDAIRLLNRIQRSWINFIRGESLQWEPWPYSEVFY